MKIREPVGPVQLQPPGLLGLLQLKVGGFVPDALLQTVQPEVDMLEFWLRAAAEHVQVDFARSIAGPAELNQVEILIDAATATQPLGPGPQEWWYVHNYDVRVADTGGVVGTPVYLAPAYTVVGGPTGGLSLAVLAPITAVPGDTYYPLQARGFWVPPGAQLGVWVSSYTGPLELQLIGCMLTRCPI